MDVFRIGMRKLKSPGICAQCKYGAMIGPDYKITCLVIRGLHHRNHSCPSFEEDK